MPLFPNLIISSVLMTLLFSLLLESVCCYNLKFLNVSKIHQHHNSNNWSPAGATWYGGPKGAGSDGGACGYKDTVEKPPFSTMVSAGGSSIYDSGQGCGVCYKVKCTENKACAGKAVTLTITDECPGCPSDKPHFDLSGAAFGAMAKPGFENQLRDAGLQGRIQEIIPGVARASVCYNTASATAGLLNIQYQRVKCNYPGFMVEVRVDPGSNMYYFASIFEYANGQGIESVKLKQQTGAWITMQRSWGAIWKLNAGTILQSPFSLQLVEANSGAILNLDNVIPKGWKPGHTYHSHVNFNN